MDFGFESSLIILLLVALLVILICHKQIKSSVLDHKENNGNNENFDNKTIVYLDDPVYDNFMNDMMYNKIEKKKRKLKNNYCVASKHHKHHKYNKHHNTHDIISDMDELVSMMGKNKSCRKKIHTLRIKPEVNVEFADMQYHKDYNDVITAINNLTSQKELFNMGFLPVIETEPNKGNVKSLVKLFMSKMNNDILNNVQEYLHVNSGWNDMGKRRREKSGFEQQMEELGLPGSLYNEPAEKAPIKLIKIDKSVQFTTDDQIRFTIYIIVQKENVKDQMVLQVQFFMEREDLSGQRDDRANFFEKGLDSPKKDSVNIDPNQLVIIEQVFILGYLTNETSPKTKMDKFHNYDNTQRIDGTIDQEKVIKMMLIKHKERENELNSFVNTLNDDSREIYDISGPSGVDQYSQFTNTRTIMDDFAQFPQRAFGDVVI